MMVTANVHHTVAVTISEPIIRDGHRWQNYTFWSENGIALEVCAFLTPEAKLTPAIHNTKDD